MRMLLGGAWVDRRNKIEVINPFDGSLVDTVPQSSLSDVEQALVTAERGARAMRELTGYQRYEILHKVADLLCLRMDDLARTITSEEGKILGESRMEVIRAREIISLSAEEAKRLSGDVVPLDGAPGVSDRIGFTVRFAPRHLISD